MPILVSFIIPHKGRAVLLERTLQSICRQTYDLNAIETFVATQEQHLRLSETYDKVNLKFLYCQSRDKIGALRNKGAKAATGTYLAFIDADIELAPDWLNVMLEELAVKKSRVMVSAKPVASSEESAVERIWLRLNDAKTGQSVDALNARNLFLSKKTFEKAGGFPEDLTTCEDIYFTNKVSRTGRVYITSKTFHMHLGEDKTYAEMFSKEIWRSQSNYGSIRGRKLPLAEMPSLLLPVWEVIFFVLLVAGMIARNTGLIIASCTALFTPIVFYAIRIYLRNAKELNLVDCVRFYAVYFAARTIGSIKGLLPFK